MPLTIRTTWTNHNPNTIWNRLAARLGREPSNEEAAAEVRRIIQAATIETTQAGRLPHQRKR